MALPKEPRQKMINIMYLVLTALLAMNVSSEILNAFKTVDASLQSSSANLSTANSTIYQSLTDKLNDSKTSAQAAVWKPKADQAKKLSDDMMAYLDGLKQELIKESGGSLVNGQQTYKEDNLDASSRLMVTGGKGKELQQRLQAYREAMLNIDPEIRKEFEKTLAIDANPVKLSNGEEKAFDVGYFNMNPTVASITLLSKFQNNVKNAENQVATFAHSKIGEVKVRYDKFGVLVGQTASYVMPGQDITITAGVGAYSSAAAPQISINGSGVPTVDGKGTYTFKAGGGGAHTVPVTIRYKDQNGVDQTATSNVQYTVGTPGGAAVMLDKMNVFYIGVDNPITIGSPTGWDKTNVSMSGGSLSGSGSNRTVRVSSPGTASITVNADGKPSTFQFRVKKIPNPVFKIGTGGSRMAAVQFKGQQFCRADLEGFDFDARFSVTGATVYFYGAGFPSPAQTRINGNSLASLSAFMAKAGPGTSIAFENITVQGPDGSRPIEGRTFQLY